MSARMQLPLSQQRHSNVAVVRLSKGGVRLELPCYKNKIMAFREGVETNEDEVVQIARLFTDVGKGKFASLKEIQTVCGKDVTEAEAISMLLKDGEYSVTQGERKVELEKQLLDIATFVGQKTVHRCTGRRFPVSMLVQLLRQSGFKVHLDRSAKVQALNAIQSLVTEQEIPIRRAPMELSVCGVVPDVIDVFVKALETHDFPGVVTAAVVSSEDTNAVDVKLLVDSEHYRRVDKWVEEHPPLRLTVLSTSYCEATDEGSAVVVEASVAGSTLVPVSQNSILGQLIQRDGSVESQLQVLDEVCPPVLPEQPVTKQVKVKEGKTGGDDGEAASHTQRKKERREQRKAKKQEEVQTVVEQTKEERQKAVRENLKLKERETDLVALEVDSDSDEVVSAKERKKRQKKVKNSSKYNYHVRGELVDKEELWREGCLDSDEYDGT